MNALLEVRDLRTCFTTDDGEFAAVDGVSFEVHAGKTLAIVGESGCGKSVTSLSIMGLVSAPAGAIRAGSIRFEGQQLVGASDETLQNLRGNGMAMVFQEPMTSLNPAYTVGDQIMEALLRHRPMDRAQARERALEMLGQVRIPAPEQRLHEYPHQLSGGMRQRPIPVRHALIGAATCALTTSAWRATCSQAPKWCKKPRVPTKPAPGNPWHGVC